LKKEKKDKKKKKKVKDSDHISSMSDNSMYTED